VSKLEKLRERERERERERKKAIDNKKQKVIEKYFAVIRNNLIFKGCFVIFQSCTKQSN